MKQKRKQKEGNNPVLNSTNRPSFYSFTFIVIQRFSHGFSIAHFWSHSSISFSHTPNCLFFFSWNLCFLLPPCLFFFLCHIFPLPLSYILSLLSSCFPCSTSPQPVLHDPEQPHSNLNTLICTKTPCSVFCQRPATLLSSYNKMSQNYNPTSRTTYSSTQRNWDSLTLQVWIQESCCHPVNQEFTKN